MKIEVDAGGKLVFSLFKMKTRYTCKQLEKDLIALNEKLARANHEYRFVIGARYGYTAIDLATPEQEKRHCVARTLDCGTPKGCLNACYAYIAQNCA